MVELTERPFPPGRYPLVVVGSGPGALQLTYSLRRLGIEHAVLSRDDEPGGMFRRWPIFQRMLSWTKPYAEHEHGTSAYERYDWNSLLGDDASHRAIMPEVMDGTSYFPSRPEMAQGLRTFAERTGLEIRYGCTWESTRREGGDQFVLTTSDGAYRTGIVVFAVGIAEPWKPQVLDVEGVQQYGELHPAESYAGRRIFIVGKQNSGFEIATGLLPWARQIVLASPSRTKLSVDTRTLVGVRARYVQPYEDWALAGGVVILDASIEHVERTQRGYVVSTQSVEGRSMKFEVDDVIAATGFVSPLQDLPELGVATFGQSRIPTQTPFWESATVPGVYFAGTIMQGAQGLRKFGIPSNSGAVQGYRYNARVLARHIAATHFGVTPARPRIGPDEVVPFLLAEASLGPELWHQRSYLCRVIAFDPDAGISDEGIQPLAHFVDGGGGDAAAVTLEANGKDNPYPVVYVRSGGAVRENTLTPPHPMLDYRGAEYEAQVAAALNPVLGRAPTRSAQ
ncbi:MAG TPA: NAD(P)-binding domain-containing protein [Candidatus Limnocylindrales bacterium]|nr:NAD(P)-binding domain-containing protein [Candidatus Limnocylindrales bacterium]